MDSPTLKLAKQLLERPSISPNDNGCQEILAAYLSKIGFHITYLPSGPVSNLFAKIGTSNGDSKRDFCFSGHTDVVPVGNLKDWKSDPFTPTIEDGVLTARGAADMKSAVAANPFTIEDGVLTARRAADMKSAVAAMVVAAERFVSSHPNYPGTISFLITSDEEDKAVDGTQAALRELKKLNCIPGVVLVGEASSSVTLGDVIRVGRRGSLCCSLKIIGKQGHVAYPELAINPIHVGFQPLREISEYVWDNGQEPFPPTSLQFSNIKSGTGAKNVIPGVLEADFNLRYSPKSNPTDIQNKVEEILTSHSCKYEIEWTLKGKPFYTNPNEKLIATVVKTIHEELGITTDCSTGGGTSDGRFFAEYGCHVVELGNLFLLFRKQIQQRQTQE